MLYTVYHNLRLRIIDTEMTGTVGDIKTEILREVYGDRVSHCCNKTKWRLKVDEKQLRSEFEHTNINSEETGNE